MKPIWRYVQVFALIVAINMTIGLSAQTFVSPLNNHRYQIKSRSATNAPFTTVRNLEENDWIFQTFGMYKDVPHALWIGLNDLAEEGTFIWAGGETNDFRHWAPSQPANDSTKNHVLIFPPGHEDEGKWGVFTLTNGLAGASHRAILEFPALPWFSPGFDWYRYDTGPSWSQGNDIALDPNGNIYVAGFSGTNTFSDTNIVGFGARDVFLGCFDVQGNLQWMRTFGSSGTDMATGVAVDATQNVYLVGTFQGTVHFDETILTAEEGTSGLFLSKFDESGALLWAINPGPTNITPHRIGVDGPGNIYFTGSYQGTASFGSTNLVSEGSSDVFLAKFSPQGDLIWVRSAGGSGIDMAFRIAVSPAGESVITGTFTSPNCTFGSITLTNAGARDLFLAKYDTDGNVLWARRDGGTFDDWGNGVTFTGNGEVVLTGFFKGITQFDSTSVTNINGTNHWDLFIAKYDENGELSWIRREGGSQNDLGNDVVCDSEGNLYLIFTYYGDTIIGGAILPDENYPLGETYVLPSLGMVKLTSEGEVIWSQTFGSPWITDGLAIAVDERGRAYFTGIWGGSRLPVGRTGLHLPKLQIQQADTKFVLSWPTNFPSFTLESKAEWDETWMPIESPTAVVKTMLVITNEPGSSKTFYRLNGIEQMQR